MSPEDLAHLKEILDRWGPGVPEGLTATRDGDAALFHDKNGVLRMAMPWEDYEAIQKWYADEHKETAV